MQIGMSDGTNTEIISGISRGAKIVTGIKEVQAEEETAQGEQEQSPFAPGPKRNDKKK